MTRAIAEWFGKTDDTPAPPRVLLRIFEREDGCCHICGLKIRGKKWQADHKGALINGGKNCESNLFPVHVVCHGTKNKADLAIKSKTAAIAGAHAGIKRKSQPIRNAGFPETGKRPKIDKSLVTFLGIPAIARRVG